MMPPWVEALMKVAREIVPRDFVGKIEINAFKGGISNINIQQSFKEDTAK